MGSKNNFYVADVEPTDHDRNRTFDVGESLKPVSKENALKYEFLILNFIVKMSVYNYFI